MRFASILLAALLLAGPASAYTTAGRVTYWMGEDNALDSWGYWDMVAANMSGYAPGLNGQAFSFDGIDDYVTLGPVTTSPFRQATGISYSFWANIPVGGGGYAIGAAGNDMGHGFGGVAYNLVDGRFGLDWTPSSPIGDTTFSGALTITPDVWHHVVVTADFSLGSVALYLDGAPVTVDFMSNVPTDYSPHAPYTPNGGEDTVGARIIDGAVVGAFEGLMDDVMLYERALTPAEVAGIYIEQIPEPSTGLLVLFGLAATAAARRPATRRRR